jgi:hypothetical protein
MRSQSDHWSHVHRLWRLPSRPYGQAYERPHEGAVLTLGAA